MKYNKTLFYKTQKKLIKQNYAEITENWSTLQIV